MADDVWKTADGRVIPIDEMDIDHLRNALRFMIRLRRRAIRRGAMLRALEDKRIDLIMKLDKEFWDQETHERLGDDS
jgi:hypothetical protein